jgi:Zn-dependent protease
MQGWWVAQWWEQSPVLLISWVVWVIVSVVLHELSHGWAAIRCGDRTPIELGHMTWNPVVHMPGMSLIMFGLFGFTWGLMPVDPTRFRGRHDDAIVAAAGPAMNLLLALVSLVLYTVWVGIGGGYWIHGVSVPDPLFSNVQTFFRIGLVINVVGVLFNLIPIPPLDGSRIVGSFSRRYERLWEGEHAQYVGLAAFGLLFFVVGPRIFDVGFSAARYAIHAAMSVAVPGARP